MYSVVIMAALATNGPDAVAFHRHGCVGANAGCTSAQAGCVGRSGGCHGLFGRGVLRRPLLRRNHGCFGCAGGQASAPVKPAAAPMPRSAAECPQGQCPTTLASLTAVVMGADGRRFMQLFVK